VLRLVTAADGQLARVRLPGGLVDGGALRALGVAARELGDGRLELTSRGNVQLRGLREADGPELGGRLADAGLWPSVTHERVRNIVASPQSDLDDQVRALDAALCADPRLAELSGRFLFGIDDGSGDIAALAPDVLGAADSAPQDLLAVAHAFLDELAAQASDAWRIDELVNGRVRVCARLGVTVPGPAPAPPPAPAGPVPGGHVLLVPLGRLTADQADWLAGRTGSGTAKITPWRSVLLPTTDVSGAGEAGFGLDVASRWYRVSACAGQPGCAKALADVQSEAARTADTWHAKGVGVHFSGCGRRCGRPVGTVVDVIATEDGYVNSSA
jgi:precorrin-3B synthase